jgi:hypothetical protein
VIASRISLVVGLLMLAQTPAGAGSIGGRVVNSTRGESPVGAAEVLLQIRVDGEFVVVARTTADSDGRFLFEGLPVDQGLLYLPGSTRDGIHYPGPRLALSPDRPSAQVVLKIRETIAEPNPLVLRDYDLVLQPEPGALRVTETMVIENPEPATYVGRNPHGGVEPVTLQLGIPADFERVTFDKEFYGRGFSLINEKLVTGIPWTPGQRELRFTYILRNDGRQRLWSRPLDLPCRHVRLTVRTEAPEGVSCNLAASSRREDGGVVVDSQGRELPAGFTIRVELSRLPVSVMAYARWVVLAALALVIAGSCLVMRHHRCALARREPVKPPHRRSRKARVRA